jgi:DNA-binding transcriptional regulator YdaS (Cro superfamily)
MSKDLAENPRKQLIKDACKKAGGQTALAKALGLSSQGSISRWVSTGRIPAERVLDVERATGVPRHELRPDLYPQETA